MLIWRYFYEKCDAVKGIDEKYCESEKDIGAAYKTLSFALNATAKKRGSTDIMKQYREIMETVINSKVMNQQWHSYQKDFEYARNITFHETCHAVMKVMETSMSRQEA